MTRLVVVLPLSPLSEGDSFAVRDWPLHITVLPPFDTDAGVAEIVDAVASVTVGQSELTVVAAHGELFGRRHDIPVTVLADNDELTDLHRRLIGVVKPFGVSPEERAFTGPGFRPHITSKHHSSVHGGDQFVLKQIALVDMMPRASPGGRSVLATVPLQAIMGAS